MACSKAGRKATVIFIVSPTPIISSAKSSKHMEEIFKIIGIHFYSHYKVHSKSWFFIACPMLSVNRTQCCMKMHEMYKKFQVCTQITLPCVKVLLYTYFFFFKIAWVCMHIYKKFLFFFGINKPCEQFPF